MRAAFIQTLTELAGRDERIILLTGDLGYLAIEEFAQKFPRRFFNVGVAEQNMVGIATGLAEAGFIPFVYSIVPFAVLRPYEFIRNGPVQHKLPVRIVGIGGGFEYGTNGLSHYGLEDIALMRVQPGMTVIAPADAPQTRTALEKTWALPGPVYYRIGKNAAPAVPGLEGRFEPGRLQVVVEGSDVVILALGGIAGEALQAAALLNAQGISCGVGIVSCISPAPAPDLENLLRGKRLALTVEAHYVCGGLGSMVAEVIAEAGLHCRLLRCGVRSLPDGISGSTASMHRRNHLHSDQLMAAALAAQ